jgi:hypothetical protein
VREISKNWNFLMKRKILSSSLIYFIGTVINKQWQSIYSSIIAITMHNQIHFSTENNEKTSIFI